VIMDALVAFDHLLIGYELTIIIHHKPMRYLRTDRRSARKQLRWRTQEGKYMPKIVYKPGVINYLTDALFHFY